MSQEVVEGNIGRIAIERNVWTLRGRGHCTRTETPNNDDSVKLPLAEVPRDWHSYRNSLYMCGKRLLKGGQEFMFNFKKIGLMLFVIIVIGYFWIILFLDRKITFERLGHFNCFPPRVSVDKFKDVPVQGSIMEELAALCKNNAPSSIGLSWADYQKIVTIARGEYEYSYMMFEKLYDLYQNPVRLKPGEIGRMNDYITFLEEANAKPGIPILKTRRFGLFKKDT